MTLMLVLPMILLALGAWALLVFNGLVRLRNQVRTAWADIDVQLQRRHDLVPQLVATVQGYAGHEHALLEAVTALRAQALTQAAPAQLGELENALQLGLGRLFALKEAYPDLKANQSFLSLQQSLAETEGMIAGARQGYNAAVRDLNTRIESVPTNFFAGAFGFTRREFFEIEDPADREPVSVSFDK